MGGSRCDTVCDQAYSACAFDDFSHLCAHILSDARSSGRPVQPRKGARCSDHSGAGGAVWIESAGWRAVPVLYEKRPQGRFRRLTEKRAQYHGYLQGFVPDLREARPDGHCGRTGVRRNLRVDRGADAQQASGSDHRLLLNALYRRAELRAGDAASARRRQPDLRRVDGARPTSTIRSRSSRSRPIQWPIPRALPRRACSTR